MSYINAWFNNVVKIDLIYKVNVTNSYNIPYINKVSVNTCLHFNDDGYDNVLPLTTSIMLLVNQKPIIHKTTSPKIFSRLQKDSSINVRITLRKHSAFDLLDNLVLLTALKKNKIKISKLNCVNSMSIRLADLTFFSNFSIYLDLLLFKSNFLLNLGFNLSHFYIAILIVSSLQIPYR